MTVLMMQISKNMKSLNQKITHAMVCDFHKKVFKLTTF